LYLSAMIFGLATFAKTPNFVCILPLIAFEAYFKNYKQIAKITITFLFTTLILFGINYGITGNLSLYGHQYYYVSKYPYLEGCDANCSLPPEGTNVIGDLIKPSILSFSGLRWFGYNIFYYFFGRFTGAIWYYPFILLSIFSVLILAYNYTIHYRRFLVGHSNLNFGRMLLPIIVISYILIYLYLSYDNWPINYFGGQGAIGNRYFYIYPAFFYLIGKIEFTKQNTAMFSLIMLMSLVFILPLTAIPYEISDIHSTINTANLPYPFEYTILNSLSFLVPVLDAPIKTSLNPMGHAALLPYRILPLEYTVLDALPLWNPPAATLNYTKFYFIQPNVEVTANALVITGSYPELLFKSGLTTYYPCLQASRSLNLTLKSGNIAKSITLEENQEITVDLPIKPFLQVNEVRENEYVYKLGIFFNENNSSNDSIILKLK
jgi:hypothetical protein